MAATSLAGLSRPGLPLSCSVPTGKKSAAARVKSEAPTRGRESLDVQHSLLHTTRPPLRHGWGHQKKKKNQTRPQPCASAPSPHPGMLYLYAPQPTAPVLLEYIQEVGDAWPSGGLCPPTPAPPGALAGAWSPPEEQGRCPINRPSPIGARHSKAPPPAALSASSRTATDDSQQLAAARVKSETPTRGRESLSAQHSPLHTTPPLRHGATRKNHTRPQACTSAPSPHPGMLYAPRTRRLCW